METLILSQDQLRLYNLCSERFYLSSGEEVLGDPKIRAIEKAFEYLIVQELDGYPFGEKDTKTLFLKAVQWLASKAKLTIPEYQDVAIRGAAIFDTFLSGISLKKYIPIWGPLDQNIKLRELVITTHISGIARTPIGAIRAWTFSPYELERDILWDPIHRIQYEYLIELSKEHEGLAPRFSPILYIGYLTKGSIRLTSIDKLENQDKYHKAIESIESLILNNHKYPIVPCPYSLCPFRKECKLS